MISVITGEIRKNYRRPAFRVGAALVALLVALNYGIGLAELIWPSIAPQGGLDVANLYPDKFVNSATGAVGLAAAIAMVVGALMAGSEFSWGTFKTALTQRAGRLTTIGGRVAAYLFYTAVLTLIILVMSVIGSVIVAVHESHAITWPAAIDMAKGFGAIWLALSVSGTLGIALGTLVRQPAAAVGIGLVYGLALQVLVVRFVAGINDGQFKWLANLFEGENTQALMRSFGGVPSPDITPERAVLVLVAYVAVYVAATAALVRQRDVT
jgi:ABC-2 type transport system permease protein